MALSKLLSYVKDAIQEIQLEINEKERKIHDCKGCFEHANLKTEFESKIEK